MTDIVTVGGQVPNFELEVYDPKKGTFGKTSLEESMKQKKWTVLFFYPADYTFVCPTELADLASKADELEKSNVQVISVSTDTKFVHMAWQREEKLLKDVKYLMGADATKKVSKLFGVLDEETGLAFRGTFIISPDGKLTASEVNFFNVGRSAEELVRKVNANVYLVKHPAEACPANWTEGQKTLTPSEALVGRVAEALASK